MGVGCRVKKTKPKTQDVCTHASMSLPPRKNFCATQNTTGVVLYLPNLQQKNPTRVGVTHGRAGWSAAGRARVRVRCASTCVPHFLKHI